MMKRIRIFIAALFFLGITLLFVGIGQDWWGWMARIQLLPTVMRVLGGAALGNVAVLCAILLATFVFGRIYCSVICPLGILQDLVIRLRRLFKRKKKTAFVPERKWLRYGILALAVLCIVLNFQVLIALVAPYSAYGRIVRAFATLGGNGSLVPALLVTAFATLLVVGACAWMWGRAWCNNICPVGTLLGTISRYSLFTIRIDTDKCRDCGSCARECRAHCIDAGAHRVDMSRCVDCFDCLGNCKFGAISYGLRGAGCSTSAEQSRSRRNFLGTIAAVAIPASLSGKGRRDSSVIELKPKQTPQRSERLVPFGAESVEAFYDRCTACQLCVSACPNSVLRPSSDPAHFLQPVMGYDKGWCRPECNACADACPSGAIRPLEKGAKLSMKIGTAHVNPELCLSANGQERCGNCVKHCPVGAITMLIPDDGELPRPVVMEDICTGCGACEYLCPVRPVSAITVDGVSVHHNS